MKKREEYRKAGTKLVIERDNTCTKMSFKSVWVIQVKSMHGGRDKAKMLVSHSPIMSGPHSFTDKKEKCVIYLKQIVQEFPKVLKNPT